MREKVETHPGFSEKRFSSLRKVSLSVHECICGYGAFVANDSLPICEIIFVTQALSNIAAFWDIEETVTVCATFIKLQTEVAST